MDYKWYLRNRTGFSFDSFCAFLSSYYSLCKGLMREFSAISFSMQT